MVQTMISPRPIDVVGPASSAGGGSSKSGTGCHWWQEWEIGLLVLLVAAVYFTRMDVVSLRGEETRRAGIAIEMVHRCFWGGLPEILR